MSEPGSNHAETPGETMNETMSETIEVCVCTFRRESLAATLASLAAQTLPGGCSLRVIVADNDHTDDRRARIEAAAQTLGIALRYVHAPARNISIARNACLTAATADWIAFIDDDEVARPDWLARLIATRDGHEVVFGISQAGYPDPATPGWIVAGDFHSNRLSGNDPPWNGYTANVLIDRRFTAAQGLRFAEELGQTGGEDTLFFYSARGAGARFGYAPLAIVDEATPLARASLRWLALRRFRAGQIHHMLLREQGGAGRGSVAAAAKAGVCLLAALIALPRPARAAAQALRGALHVGVVAAALGFAPYREYGGVR